ncbi:hypothetical protein NDU88_003294 [Pleurodeles waltl]|uniref:Uncharacterized protein n=1 Tax=Pleurodeles waltl TaxID=8319 RepID=A0AAV7WSP1_PLEWA|nr:hypothetical protein NDU88_003294 [Pleurodeles waltl]
MRATWQEILHTDYADDHWAGVPESLDSEVRKSRMKFGIFKSLQDCTRNRQIGMGGAPAPLLVRCFDHLVCDVAHILYDCLAPRDTWTALVAMLRKTALTASPFTGHVLLLHDKVDISSLMHHEHCFIAMEMTATKLCILWHWCTHLLNR